MDADVDNSAAVAVVLGVDLEMEEKMEAEVEEVEGEDVMRGLDSLKIRVFRSITRRILSEKVRRILLSVSEW